MGNAMERRWKDKQNDKFRGLAPDDGFDAYHMRLYELYTEGDPEGLCILPPCLNYEEILGAREMNPATKHPPLAPNEIDDVVEDVNKLYDSGEGVYLRFVTPVKTPWYSIGLATSFAISSKEAWDPVRKHITIFGEKHDTRAGYIAKTSAVEPFVRCMFPCDGYTHRRHQGIPGCGCAGSGCLKDGNDWCNEYHGRFPKGRSFNWDGNVCGFKPYSAVKLSAPHMDLLGYDSPASDAVSDATETCGASDDCTTAVHWAMTVGIVQYKTLFAGLLPSDSFDKFHQKLYEAKFMDPDRKIVCPLAPCPKKVSQQIDQDQDAGNGYGEMVAKGSPNHRWTPSFFDQDQDAGNRYAEVVAKGSPNHRWTPSIFDQDQSHSDNLVSDATEEDAVSFLSRRDMSTWFQSNPPVGGSRGCIGLALPSDLQA